MKKVIIINGSPRKNANSDAITDLAVKELEARGASVEVFRIRERDVRSCIGCDKCKATDECVQKDDAAELMKKFKQCNGVLLVAPIYFNSVPGTIKVLIDRFYSMFNPAKGLVPPSPDKKFAAIFSFGGSPESEISKVVDWSAYCFGVAGFGSHRSVLCSGQNTKDAFANNKEHQAKVQELIKWF